jgi:uncharacterized NAD(P)/FAD-binding protein YdhS
VDSIRPVSQAIWRTLTPRQREQFLRHLSRFWDVHRNRMAPFVGRLVTQWQEEGRLTAVKADVAAIRSTGDEVIVSDAAGRSWSADRVAIATGPDTSCDKNRLVAHMHDSCLVTPGPCGIGINLEPSTHRVIDATGTVNLSMYVIGTPTKGVLFESTGMPDIRNSAVVIAESIRDR